MAKTKQTVPPALVADLLTQWRAGGRLPALGKIATEALGRPIAPVSVRGWIVKELGGEEAYRTEFNKREESHPRPKLVPPTRTPRAPGEPAAPAIDDSTVPVITNTKMGPGGWQLTSITVAQVRHDVFVNPEGVKYVKAKGNEQADLIVELTGRIKATVRLRLLDGSAVGRKARKHDRLVHRGEAKRNDDWKKGTGDPEARPDDSIETQQARKPKKVHRKVR